MVAVEAFVQKRVLVVFWIALTVHCVFQYFQSPYIAATKPLLVPLLLTFLLLRDNNIGRPAGKFVFYVGLFLALFGDILLITVNVTFFLSGMIVFMVMNLCYAFCFYQLSRLRTSTILPFVFTALILAGIGYWLFSFLGDRLGDYRIPIIIYMVTVSVMICLAVNIVVNPVYRSAALQYFIPGSLVFLCENLLVAVNRFYFESNKNLYIPVIISYAFAQFLFAKGIQKAFLTGEEV